MENIPQPPKTAEEGRGNPLSVNHDKRLKKITQPETKNAEQLILLQSDDFAFDEMNLVEIPFCLLQRQATKKKTIPLSPTGDEYLEARGSRYGLPTSLAEPVVLGLLWLTMEKNKFESSKVTFGLRELVEDYMYPGQFTKYRAGGRLLHAVENELHRVAATRLHSNRWYDRSLGRHVDIDAAIIDSITTQDEGGRNSPRIIEIVWGNKIYDSVRARYTKGLDVKTWLQIDHSLDRRLYRWLDRQLYEGKTVQVVVSCQKWAKHKMLMQSAKIEKGGRTASSYIVAKVTESLNRLNGIGFAVRMTTNKSKADFSLRFEKINGTINEVLDSDPVADLVHEFLYHFNNRPREAKKCRLRESDRKNAAEWIEEYGLEKSLWMVKRCKELHQKSFRSDQRIFCFAGLEAYKETADPDYERTKQEKSGQLVLEFKKIRKKMWSKYCEALIKKAEEETAPEESDRIRREIEKDVLKSNHSAFVSNIESAMDVTVDVLFKGKMLQRANAMNEEAFIECKTEELLEKMLLERHGYNPLADYPHSGTETVTIRFVRL